VPEPAPLIRALDAVPAIGAHLASPAERAVIEAAITHDDLDGIRHDLPEQHNGGGTPHWFVARGGFACLLATGTIGLLCRCWVQPARRGNGVAVDLYKARAAHAAALGLARLDVVLSQGSRSQVMRYLDRGFRVAHAPLAGARVRLTKNLRVW